MARPRKVPWQVQMQKKLLADRFLAPESTPSQASFYDRNYIIHNERRAYISMDCSQAENLDEKRRGKAGLQFRVAAPAAGTEILHGRHHKLSGRCIRERYT